MCVKQFGWGAATIRRATDLLIALLIARKEARVQSLQKQK